MENIYLPKELFTESEQKIDGNTIKRCLSEQIGAYETDCLIYAIAKKNPEERVVELPFEYNAEERQTISYSELVTKAIIPANLKVKFDMSKSFPDLDEATTINFNCGYSVFEMVYEINGEVYGVLTTAVNNTITEMIYDGQFSTDTEEVSNT